jgi:hypothetical protein
MTGSEPKGAKMRRRVLSRGQCPEVQNGMRGVMPGRPPGVDVDLRTLRSIEDITRARDDLRERRSKVKADLETILRGSISPIRGLRHR